MALRLPRVPGRAWARARRGVGHAEAGRGQGATVRPAHSWLLGNARTLAISLAVASAALFVVAALGLFGHADWWRTVAVVASGVSIALMTLFFNPWLVAGWGLNAGLIAGIVWFAWPSQILVGA